MRLGESALGVMTGVLLALGIVALAGSGFNPYATQATSPTPGQNSTASTSTRSMTTTNTSGAMAMVSGSNKTDYPSNSNAAEAAPPYSHLDSFTVQPISLTGFVLIPIFAALLFGFVFYRASKVHNEEEEPQRAA
jgi:hypothetical protein